ACWDLVPAFPQRSPPRLLTAAACGGLRSAPDRRTRRALLHLSYSCAPPILASALVTHDPQRSSGRIRGTGVTEYRSEFSDHSGLMPANFTTLPHFSVSAAMKLPKSEGEPAITVPPRSASRALSWGSARAALISLLSLLTISAGVPLGPPTPY